MLGGTTSLAKASTEDYHNREMRSINILMDRSINILGTEEPGTLTKGRVSKGDLNFNWDKGLLTTKLPGRRCWSKLEAHSSQIIYRLE